MLPQPCHTPPDLAASCQNTSEPAVLCHAVPQPGSPLLRCTHPALAPLLCLPAGRAGSLPVGAEGQSRARCAGREGSGQSRGPGALLLSLSPLCRRNPVLCLSAPFLHVSGGMVKRAQWGLPSACCAQGQGQPVYCKCPAAASLQVPWASRKEGWGGQRTAARGGWVGGDAGRRLLCVLILPGECLRVSGMQIRSRTALLRNLATSLSTGLQPEEAPGGGGGELGLPR